MVSVAWYFNFSFHFQAQAQVQDLSKQLKHAQQINNELSTRNGELERDNAALNSQNTSLAAELAKFKAHCNDLQDRVDNLTRENKQLSGMYQWRLKCKLDTELMPVY